MKKIITTLVLIAVGLVSALQAQVTVGSATAPNSNAVLDLTSNGTKGLLLPRVALTSTSSFAPLAAHVAGMTVYNTATVGDVTPGYYYNNGSKWLRLADASAAGWSLTGNSGTTVGTNFVGTTDAVDFVTKVKSTEAMRAIWDATNSVTRMAVGTATAATVASSTSGSTTAQQKAAFTMVGGDASINGLTIGLGGGQQSGSIAIGNGALYNAGSSTTPNAAIGNSALYNYSTGGYGGNTAVGNAALMNSTTAGYNTAVGNAALGANTTGGYSIALGYYALLKATGTSNSNTALGALALQSLVTGQNNIAIGQNAGGTQTAGDNNIVIGGANQYLANTSGSNQLNIGGAIFGTGLTGNQSTPAGNIGIGTAAPNTSAALDVTATNKGFLPPRVALASSTDQTTIALPATGLVVYNTSTNANGPGLTINNGTPASPQWAVVAVSGTVSGTGVIGTWSGSNSGNTYTGTITSSVDGISFRSSVSGIGGVLVYTNYAMVSSGTQSISAFTSEEGTNGWYWKGQNSTSVGTSFTVIDQGSGVGMGSGKRTGYVVNNTTGAVYRLTLLIDSASNTAVYIVEKVK